MSTRFLSRHPCMKSAFDRAMKARTSVKRSTQLGCDRAFSTVPVAAQKNWERPVAWVLAGTLVTASAIGYSNFLGDSGTTTSLDALAVHPLGPISIGDPGTFDHEPTVETSVIEEPETKITFPPVFRSKHLLGLGVRKKYSFVNVYAVGFYVSQGDFRDITDEDEREDALLNPHRHRIIRIVMNRTLTMETVVQALIEAIEPRMHGKDLFALEEFSKMRSCGSLQKGDEVILTIRGASLDCWCSNGGKGSLQSEVFTRAVMDVYFGQQPISPAAKASAMKGIQ